MKTLIICEDPTYDQHIVKPIMKRLFEDIGKISRLDVLHDPHFGGIGEALNAALITQVIEDNPTVDLFIIVADRDCDRTGASTKAATREGEHQGKLLVCLAQQEIEVWMLSVFRDLPAPWQEIRQNCDPKEAYAVDLIRDKGWEKEVGKGYKRAMREIAGRWTAVKSRCPEVVELGQRIAAL